MTSKTKTTSDYTGTDADFDSPAHDKSLGRDAHGRPMLTFPRSLLVNEAPRRTTLRQGEPNNE